MSLFSLKRVFEVSNKEKKERIKMNLNNINGFHYSLTEKNADELVLTPTYHLSLNRRISPPKIFLRFATLQETIQLTIVCTLPTGYKIFDGIISILSFFFELFIILTYVNNGNITELFYHFPTYIPIMLFSILNVGLLLSLHIYSKKVFNYFNQLLIAQDGSKSLEK